MITMNKEEFADLLVAVNPDRGSSLRFLLLIPFNGGTVMASAGRWPGSRSLYCLPLSPRRWPHEPELIARIPVLSCVRRGATIDLVLDRGRSNRAQFVYTECGGRRMAGACAVVPSSRSTVKKSVARIAWACERRNWAQLGPERRGAGSIPAFLRIAQTVEGATWIPRPADSPVMRR